MKIKISNDGVFADDVKIPGVMSAEIRNINIGHSQMEVHLIFEVSEVDVQYKQRQGVPAELISNIA